MQALDYAVLVGLVFITGYIVVGLARKKKRGSGCAGCPHKDSCKK